MSSARQAGSADPETGQGGQQDVRAASKAAQVRTSPE
jgi:hypothetical protein